MKIQKLIRGLIVALVLASPVVGAKDYPAANFQPTVIYSDTDDKQSTSSSTSSHKAEISQPDSNYPAANFQPTVVYSDAGYKHQSSNTSKKTTIASPSLEESMVEESVEESEDSIVTLFGLLVLAAVGFVLLKRKSLSAPATPKKRSHVISETKVTGSTGVARYLSKNMPELSTVAKYLRDKNSKVPTSGVSKYMAKKVVAAKAAAVTKITGVEKYLRDQG